MDRARCAAGSEAASLRSDVHADDEARNEAPNETLNKAPNKAHEDVAAWRRAARESKVDSALRTIHLKVAEAVREARPLCVASGRCCRFEAFGHRLYVTGLEAAWALAQLEREPSVEEIDRAVADGSCPFLREGLCSIHEVRPFACRTYFCDPRAHAWQQGLHESCHSEVRAVHERLGIPYRYGEWRAVLRALVAENGGARRDGT